MSGAPWAGRRLVVTGAASGIGRATAEILRAAGAEILAVDRNDPGTAADAWIRADLADPAAALAGLPGGAFHGLVNAAGLPPRAGAEAAILSVNFLGLRGFAEGLLDRLAPGSAIVSLASKAGGHWRENIDQVKRFMALSSPNELPGFVAAEGIDPVRAYDLSKEAVIAWTRAITGTLMPRGLRANAVSPAAVDTPILDDFVEAFGERATRGIALTGRAGTAREVAEVVAFLLSPGAEWVRGCNIEADGGLSAQLDTERLGLGPGGA